MKALIFIPKIYSLAEMLKDGFEENGWEAKIVDFNDLLPNILNYLYVKSTGLPRKISSPFFNKYYNLINKHYIKIINLEKPDILLIYNNQFFYPEIIEKFKKKYRIAFFLGDNPLWSKTFDYNLEILKYSDYTICPDSHWKFELSMIGMPNIVFDYIGYSKKIFHPIPIENIPEEIKRKYIADILFIGRSYRDASGYKRTLFFNSFVGYNFKIYGPKEWLKWLKQFPELQKHFVLLKERISNVELNMAINCCKIFPIDQNTGITNGIHVRVFEIIGAGALPIMEWRRDIDDVFDGLLPVIKNYNNSTEILNKYLNNNQLRLKTIESLRQLINSKYTPKLMIERLIKSI